LQVLQVQLLHTHEAHESVQPAHWQVPCAQVAQVHVLSWHTTHWPAQLPQVQVVQAS
jgi:hypothetical protein